jgi:hypothetical protein
VSATLLEIATNLLTQKDCLHIALKVIYELLLLRDDCISLSESSKQRFIFALKFWNPSRFKGLRELAPLFSQHLISDNGGSIIGISPYFAYEQIVLAAVSYHSRFAWIDSPNSLFLAPSPLVICVLALGNVTDTLYLLSQSIPIQRYTLKLLLNLHQKLEHPIALWALTNGCLSPSKDVQKLSHHAVLLSVALLEKPEALNLLETTVDLSLSSGFIRNLLHSSNLFNSSGDCSSVRIAIFSFKCLQYDDVLLRQQCCNKLNEYFNELYLDYKTIDMVFPFSEATSVKSGFKVNIPDSIAQHANMLVENLSRNLREESSLNALAILSTSSEYARTIANNACDIFDRLDTESSAFSIKNLLRILVNLVRNTENSTFSSCISLKLIGRLLNLALIHSSDVSVLVCSLLLHLKFGPCEDRVPTSKLDLNILFNLNKLLPIFSSIRLSELQTVVSSTISIQTPILVHILRVWFVNPSLLKYLFDSEIYYGLIKRFSKPILHQDNSQLLILQMYRSWMESSADATMHKLILDQLMKRMEEVKISQSSQSHANVDLILECMQVSHFQVRLSPFFCKYLELISVGDTDSNLQSCVLSVLFWKSVHAPWVSNYCLKILGNTDQIEIAKMACLVLSTQASDLAHFEFFDQFARVLKSEFLKDSGLFWMLIPCIFRSSKRTDAVLAHEPCILRMWLTCLESGSFLPWIFLAENCNSKELIQVYGISKICILHSIALLQNACLPEAAVLTYSLAHLTADDQAVFSSVENLFSVVSLLLKIVNLVADKMETIENALASCLAYNTSIITKRLLKVHPEYFFELQEDIAGFFNSQRFCKGSLVLLIEVLQISRKFALTVCPLLPSWLESINEFIVDKSLFSPTISVFSQLLRAFYIAKPFAGMKTDFRNLNKRSAGRIYLTLLEISLKVEYATSLNLICYCIGHLHHMFPENSYLLISKIKAFSIPVRFLGRITCQTHNPWISGNPDPWILICIQLSNYDANAATSDLAQFWILSAIARMRSGPPALVFQCLEYILQKRCPPSFLLKLPFCILDKIVDLFYRLPYPCIGRFLCMCVQHRTLRMYFASLIFLTRLFRAIDKNSKRRCPGEDCILIFSLTLSYYPEIYLKLKGLCPFILIVPYFKFSTMLNTGFRFFGCFHPDP